MSDLAPCELCHNTGGALLWSDDRCRIIQIDDHEFPGYCRVIWTAHVVEMTDLSPADRMHLMGIVFKLESIVREVTGADKINLASFGNVVPHLHWHVIPRWRDDAYFPQPVWGLKQRDGARRTLNQVALVQKFCKAFPDVH